MDVCTQCGELIGQTQWSLTDVVRVREDLYEVRHFCDDACYGAWENQSAGGDRVLTATVD